MMSSDAAFRELMARLAAGSNDAIQDLLRQYGPLVMTTVRRNLHQRMRSKFDSLDFVQDVWTSFFAKTPVVTNFESPDALARYLTQIARRKVIEAYRQRMIAEKYNIQRERSLDGSMRGVKDGLHAEGATPSTLVANEDEWKSFLRKQPLVYRRIFIMLREGKSNGEIAAELGIHERTIRRAACRLPPRS